MRPGGIQHLAQRDGEPDMKINLVAATVAILVSGIVMSSQTASSQAPSGREVEQIRRLDAPEGIDLTGNWVSAQWTEGGGAGNTNDRRTFDYLGVPMTEAA